MSTVTLSRRVTFSSGHRYWLSALSEEENRARFGAWASPYNHGHNYVLWVSAAGPVDPVNGMVVNIKWIDDVLQDRVVQVFNGKSINDEVPGMAGRTPTVENLLLFFRDTLRDLPGGIPLAALKLEESETFYGEWRLQDDMISITRTYEFAASHRLHVESLSHEENIRLFGKCNNPNGHGHNYVLEVTVTGEPDPLTGMIVDLATLDEVVEREIVGRYDHKNLDQDVPEFAGRNTTSEVVAQMIFDRLKDKLHSRLVKVSLFETARNRFEVVA
ncbi:MAG: 6-carboxytetrahydropterin synthase [Fimbriimonadaceae bacterium]|nr:6-carboxytetrahydropterin synthase [Fimbriimonadaceae bacterium]QYK57064.1 MAG: 6-carboxytetrahydropterin synthase [Fimbriimonadaceae bacterium]